MHILQDGRQVRSPKSGIEWRIHAHFSVIPSFGKGCQRGFGVRIRTQNASGNMSNEKMSSRASLSSSFLLKMLLTLIKR
jgi:hypothetical protein